MAGPFLYKSSFRKHCCFTLNLFKGSVNSSVLDGEGELLYLQLAFDRASFA